MSPNIVAVKESAPDPRRFTDVVNACGDRFALFAGLDDVMFEGIMLGARGLGLRAHQRLPARVPGALRGTASAATWTAPAEIYRWFMPLLHLDAGHDLVQSIKLAEQIMGRGSERVRPPRLPLTGARREEVTRLVERAAATRNQFGRRCLPPWRREGRARVL